ncbi:MAG TPA: SusC/RagA family TonB-linked outer membrane protein [Gemmatimonadaceae bacterium]|jgi:TonB-linked SusC/RagA family outer membrane protein|nr:SusC/RagA family TonB-linked outer membrane protein [Gemmatimonadaceae bacterium]
MLHPAVASACGTARGARSHRPGILLALLIALLAVISFTTTAGAQEPATGQITGVVSDSTTGQPLSSVSVSVAGTRLGDLTDAQGRYTIDRVPAGTLTLQTRRIGYSPRNIPGVSVTAGSAVTVNIALMASALTLEAVVTTGVVDPTSGTRVPFTVGHVDAADAPVPATNAVETIQGKVAGVTVVPSGQPGSGTNILLRSPTSINKSNTPLIIVDGVIQSQSFTGSTADLESLDIESVEVVKGAAAASLYGSRASAGVISIKTKRGSALPEGPPRVTIRSEYGDNSLGGKIHWARYNDYMINEAGQYIDEDSAVVDRSDRVEEPVYKRFQDNPYPDPIYDQVDRFFDPGQFFKNSVTVAQNSGKTNWLMALADTKEDGVVLNSGAYHQTNFRLNLDTRPRDDLRISVSGYHNISKRQELYGDTFFDLINQAPDVDLLVPDPDGTPYIFQGDPNGREENPLYVLATEDNERNRTRTQGSLAAHYTPLKWLTFDTDVSYDRSNRRVNFFLDQGLKTEGFGGPGGGPGEISETAATTDALNASASANLIGVAGPFTVRSTLRALIERENNHVTEAEGTELAAPGVRSLDNATERQLSSNFETIRSTGYFVTLGADYLGKYIFDGLVRRDGSSLFGPEERWNTYYRASASWRMAEESWWPFDAITEFKPRFSRGTAGGRPDFEDQFETFSFDPGGALVKETLGNKFLKPELATETEVGLDLIVKDRYSLQITHASTRVEDQLVEVPLAAVFGYTSQWQNAGTVEGNTWEATLQAQVLRRPNLSWRVGLVFDRSRNKITEFDRSCFTTNTIAFRCAGETLGAMYGFHFINGTGELPADAQAVASQFQRNDEGLLVWVGDGNAYTDGASKQLWGTDTTIGGTNYSWGMPIRQLDSEGNPAVVRIGDGNPDFHWGISNQVSWRNFDFYALVDADVGGQVYNQTNQRMYQYGRSADVDQVGKPDELKKPVEYYQALYSANDPTDYFVEDASFVKLRELSVRYHLGEGIINKVAGLGVKGASLSLIGRNLFTSTPYSGYDPEVGGTIVRLDSFEYPRYRTITGSIEINF